MYPTIPPGKTIVQITNDHRDFNKGYPTDFPILGDAKLVLRQMIEAVKDLSGRAAPRTASVQTALARPATPGWPSGGRS